MLFTAAKKKKPERAEMPPDRPVEWRGDVERRYVPAAPTKTTNAPWQARGDRDMHVVMLGKRQKVI